MTKAAGARIGGSWANIGVSGAKIGGSGAKIGGSEAEHEAVFKFINYLRELRVGVGLNNTSHIIIETGFLAYKSCVYTPIGLKF